MSDKTLLEAEPRTKLGSTACRRLRDQRIVPGNVYGHGEGALAISVPEDKLTPMVMAGQRIIDLQYNGDTSKALVQEVQWDTFCRRILHFDLVRVSQDERVEVEVPIHLVGTAPGVLAGGVLDHHLHSIELECLAIEVPTAIDVKIIHLNLLEAVTVGQLELPPSGKVSLPPETVVVQVIEALEVPELEGEPGAGPAEPELIGKPKGDEDEA